MTILLCEGFYGGSHKQMIDLLQSVLDCKVITLRAKKWHWQMRLGAFQLSEQIGIDEEFDTLFCTSTFSLPELLSLRPNLMSSHKILYFHENQLEYPVSDEKERDFQFGWIQILSCLVADEIWFNSKWNMDSFLNNLNSFINKTPERKPKGLKDRIINKCQVYYYPIQLPKLTLDNVDINNNEEKPIHIVWPHRWEFDKDPETFINTLYELENQNIPFYVSIIGEQYEEIPQCLIDVKTKLSTHILHYGYLPTKEDYYKVLLESDICVSTAIHEFFGVSMIEAALLGCLCICPNKLSYPEIFPKSQLYNTQVQLKKLLKNYCLHPNLVRNRENKQCEIEKLKCYTWDTLKNQYLSKMKYHEND
ncbi:hypothetical protein WA158_001509 [Blastocystis sp. Blastoise]